MRLLVRSSTALTSVELGVEVRSTPLLFPL